MSMILITATGHDHPGMVAAIAQKLFEANCNIEDTTMTRLSGEFAMILAVAPSQGHDAAQLEEHLASLKASHGLQIHCKEFEATLPDSQDSRYMLSVYGPDRTGLVSRIAGVLAENTVNITDLQTRVAASNDLYVMIFELELPAQLEAETLRSALDQASQELGLQYSLNPVEEDTL